MIPEDCLVLQIQEHRIQNFETEDTYTYVNVNLISYLKTFAG